MSTRRAAAAVAASYPGGPLAWPAMADAEELGDTERLDLANVMASARLEGQEVTPATEALAVEFLAGRLDEGTFRARVLKAARESAPRRRSGPLDPYVDAATGLLHNKLGIGDAEELAHVEAQVVAAELAL